jgi:hypothetical protein
MATIVLHIMLDKAPVTDKLLNFRFCGAIVAAEPPIPPDGEARQRLANSARPIHTVS